MDAQRTQLLVARITGSIVVLGIMGWFFFGRSDMDAYPVMHRIVVATPLVAIMLAGGWHILGRRRW